MRARASRGVVSVVLGASTKGALHMIRLDHTSIVCLALLLAASAAQAQPAQKPIPAGELTGSFRAVLCKRPTNRWWSAPCA